MAISKLRKTRVDTPSSKPKGVGAARTLITLPVGKIMRDPSQPRKTFDKDELDELAANIDAVGLVQPICVRHATMKDKGLKIDEYVIIDGERRYRAVSQLGWKMVSCVVEMAPVDPRTIRRRQLAANNFRVAVNAIDEAFALQEIKEANGWTNQQLAEDIGWNASKLGKALKLLELPETVANLIHAGQLKPAVGYVLAGVQEQLCVSLAYQAVDAKWSRRQVEAELARIRSNKGVEDLPGQMALRFDPVEQPSLALVGQASEPLGDIPGISPQAPSDIDRHIERASKAKAPAPTSAKKDWHPDDVAVDQGWGQIEDNEVFYVCEKFTLQLSLLPGDGWNQVARALSQMEFEARWMKTLADVPGGPCKPGDVVEFVIRGGGGNDGLQGVILPDINGNTGALTIKCDDGKVSKNVHPSNLRFVERKGGRP